MSTFETWTLGVAAYAALVSTGLLGLRIFELRLAGGRVAVSTSFHPGTDAMPAVLTLQITNRGHGEVTIAGLDLDGPGPVSIPLSHGEMMLEGPELPALVKARTSEVWYINVDRLKAFLRQHDYHYEVRGVATLATGQRAWESIHRRVTLH